MLAMSHGRDQVHELDLALMKKEIACPADGGHPES